jgi:hypothetical protein
MDIARNKPRQCHLWSCGIPCWHGSGMQLGSFWVFILSAWWRQDVSRMSRVVAATATIRGGPYRLLAFLNHRAIVDPLRPHVRHHLSRAASYCNHATTQKIQGHHPSFQTLPNATSPKTECHTKPEFHSTGGTWVHRCRLLGWGSFTPRLSAAMGCTRERKTWRWLGFHPNCPSRRGRGPHANLVENSWAIILVNVSYYFLQS